MKNTYSRRIQVPSGTSVNMRNIARAATLLLRIVKTIGFNGSYRQILLKNGMGGLKCADIQSFIHISLVAHYLIEFARECEDGKEAASFYAQNPLKKATTPFV
jgi:hypothetical protein